jgi:hypothetical protein
MGVITTDTGNRQDGTQTVSDYDDTNGVVIKTKLGRVSSCIASIRADGYEARVDDITESEVTVRLYQQGGGGEVSNGTTIDSTVDFIASRT